MKLMPPLKITAIQAGEQKTVFFSEYVLLFPLKGKVTLSGRDDLPVPVGSLLFQAPVPGRKLVFSPGSAALYVLIGTELLEELMGIPGEATSFLQEDSGQELLESMFSYFDLCYNQESATDTERITGAYTLLQQLEKLLHSVKPGQAVRTEPGSAPKSEMTVWLEQNFRENIALADFAAAFGFSRQHISSIFHQQTGMTFSDKLRSLRLSEAQRLLMTTGSSISEVGIASGFPNTKAFHSAFQKEFNMTPGEYRKVNRRNIGSAAAPPEGEVLWKTNKLLQEYRMVYARSDEVVTLQEEVSLEELPAEPLQQHWCDILNVDSCKDCLQTELQEQLREIQSTMHFRYIRLSNLLNSEMILYLVEERRHRFPRLLRLLEFFKSIGLTPMPVFGHSYLIMQRHEMLEGNGYSNSLEEWLFLLEELVEAAIHRWGSGWVSTWRFEFYMPSQLYGSDDPKDFLMLYEKSAQLIQRMLPEAQIGGPALSESNVNNTRWNDFFKAVSSRNLPLDFVSMELWGDYTMNSDGFTGQFGEWKERRQVQTLKNADTALAKDRVLQVRHRMAEYGLEQVPLLVSAIGVTKYQAGNAQLGGHCAAYLVKCILDIQPYVSGIGCWKALSSEAEYPDDISYLNNGCGLLTRDGLKTPSWYAWRFLSGLLPMVLFCGLRSCVTATDSDSLAILLYNCKNYSDKFCRLYQSERGAEFDNPTFYRSYSAMTENLTIHGLRKGSYRIARYLIGDRHGCLAAVHRQLGEIDPSDPTTAAYLAGLSLPWQHNDLTAIEEGPLTLSFKLQPNEVMLIRIQREF